jgi:hypothetical protein
MNTHLIAKRFSVWLLIVFTVVTSTGCCKEPVQPTTLSSPVPSMAFPSAVWNEDIITFTDPVMELVLDLPSGWYIQPRSDPFDTLSPTLFFSRTCPLQAMDSSLSCTQIQMTQRPSSVQSIEELEKSAVPSSPGIEHFEVKRIDLNGLPALWIDTELDPSDRSPVIQVLILIDSRVVLLNAYEDLSPVADIVNSIRPMRSDTVIP